jgi:hypothetical protein
MIRQTTPDKIRGKFVKYRLGDCLSIKLINGTYLGALMTGKFNAFYNLTLMDFCKETNPELTAFTTGKFFGTRFGSWEELVYAVDQRMVSCKYIDNNLDIEKVGSLKLIPNFISAGYAYLNSINQIHEYFLVELPIRIEKSKNAEKYPEIAFVSKHLIDISAIIET